MNHVGETQLLITIVLVSASEVVFMGSTNSLAFSSKFHVCDPQSKQSSSSQVIEDKETEPAQSLGTGLRLRFVDKEFFETVKTKGDEMKRSAGPSDKAFIEDLLNSRYIEPELSTSIIQEHVQRVVDARKSFNEQLQAARESIQGCAAQLQKDTEVSNSQVEMMYPEESEVQQWLTESTTSENNILVAPSDAKDSHHIHSETIPS